MASTRIVLASILATVHVSTIAAQIIFGPATTGSFQQNNEDSFRKGFSTNNNDHVDQNNLFTSAQRYDRANTAQQSANEATIAAAGFPGAVSKGLKSKALSSTFDRGALDGTSSQFANQDLSSTKSALDTGATTGSLATDTTISPFGPGAGQSQKTTTENRLQKLSDSNHLNQNIGQEASSKEVFDQGSLNKAATSAAIIGQDPYAGAVGSQGTQQADFAATRNRGAIDNYANTVASREANQNNALTNKQSLASDVSNNAVILGPYGTSSGGYAADKSALSKQAALSHFDDAEKQNSVAHNSKFLDSDYAKASEGSSVGIGAGIGGPGVSYGQSAKKTAAGYDKAAQVGDIHSTAARASSGTTKSFDDRTNDESLRTNAVILG